MLQQVGESFCISVFPNQRVSYNNLSNVEELQSQEIEQNLDNEDKRDGVQVENIQLSGVNELEEQLEMTETRCDTLRQQLDYMKQIYHDSIKPGHHVRLSSSKNSDTVAEPSNVVDSFQNSSKQEVNIISSFDKRSDQDKSSPAPTHQNENYLLSFPNTYENRFFSNNVVHERSSCAGNEGSVSQINEELNIANSSGQNDGYVMKTNETRKRRYSKHKHSLSHTNMKSRVEPIIENDYYPLDGRSVLDYRVTDEPEKPYSLQSDSDTNINSIGVRDYQKLVANVSKRKHKPKVIGVDDCKSVISSFPQDSDNIKQSKRKKNLFQKNSEKSNLKIVKVKENEEPRPVIKYKKKKNRSRDRLSDLPKDGVSYKKSQNKLKKDQLLFKSTRDLWSNDNIQEFYHNSSLPAETSSSENDSEDDHTLKKYNLSNLYKGTPTKKTKSKLTCYNMKEDESHARRYEFIKTAPEKTCINENIVLNDQNFVNNLMNKKTDNDKDSEIPSLTTKLKHPSKNFLSRFNFKNIPFVVGRSTAPSHNLGLNFQQALSIIKAKQAAPDRPAMSLAGEFLHEQNYFAMTQPRPVTALLSHISSQSTKKFSCPAMAYNQRYDTFKRDSTHGDICNINAVESCRVKSNYTSKLHEDLDQEPQKENIWVIDEDNEEKLNKPRCTCFPTRHCIDYQKLLSQYLEGNEKPCFIKHLEDPEIPKKMHSSHLRSKTKLEKSAGLAQILETILSKRSEVPQQMEMKGKDSNNVGQAKYVSEIMKRMKNDVLELHREYDKLQEVITNRKGNIEDTVKHLDIIEQKLQSKEQEIYLIISLYKEVYFLKQQVKTLKKKASSQCMISENGKSSKNITIREPTVSIRLTRLLRTVQMFQERLREE